MNRPAVVLPRWRAGGGNPTGTIQLSSILVCEFLPIANGRESRHVCPSPCLVYCQGQSVVESPCHSNRAGSGRIFPDCPRVWSCRSLLGSDDNFDCHAVHSSSRT